MKLDSSLNTETNCTLKETSFSIKASPIAFDILSNKLYSNPILAIVRELLCNAYDSHVVAGTTDIPIDVTFPNNLENTFTIRDYGTGLSKESIYELYTTFFGSNKSDSNDLTGGFGLGSKTPFAYTTSFSVTSYYNGVESKYLVTKKDGYPTIIEISDTLTTEPNGLKVSIPVSKDNYNGHKFFTEFQNYIYYIPEIKVNSNIEYYRGTTVYSKGNIICYRKNSNKQYSNNILYIKQGQNVYNININTYMAVDNYTSTLREIMGYLDIVIEVPIGTIGITPNREQLSIEDKDYNLVSNILVQCVQTFSNDFENFIEALRVSSISNIQSLVINFYNKKYLENTGITLDIYYREIYMEFEDIPYTLKIFYFDEHDSIVSKIDCKIKFEDKEKLVLLASDQFTSSKYKKFRNILTNYFEEFKNKKIYILNIDEVTKDYNRFKSKDKEKTSLQLVRNLYNYLWYANNIPNYEFNIKFMSMTKFFRNYPNQKVKRTKNTNIDKGSIYLQYADFTIKNTHTTYRSIDSYSLQYIENIIINGDNAILVSGDDKNPDASIFYNVRSILSKILNLQGQHDKVINYFKKNFNMDCLDKPIHLVFIYKSNKRYFKNYPIMTISQLKELINTFNFTVVNTYCCNESEILYNAYNTVLRFLDERVIKRDRELWVNSNFVKKIKLLHNLKVKYTTNCIEEYCSKDILEFMGKSNIKVKTIPEIPTSIRKPLLKTYNKVFSVTKYCNYRVARNELLKNLRGKDVLF